MAIYNYKIVDSNGKNKKGTVEATSEEKATDKLRAEGFTVLSVKEQGVMDKDISFGGKRVSNRDLSVFCRQFVSILNAGVTIITALDMMSEEMENKALKAACKEAQVYVEKGGTLADAFRLNPKVFPPMLINMVAAGELSGNMEVAFERLAVHFEKNGALQAKIKSALVYPVVVCIVAVVVVIVMMVAVIPTFSSMFSDMGVALPLPTRILVAMSDFMKAYWYICVIIVVGLVIGFKVFGKTDVGSTLYATISMKAPVLGNLVIKSNSAQFARTLSTLMASGIPLIDAMEQVSKMLGNKLFRECLVETKSQIAKGVPMSKPLKDGGVFPSMLTQMVKIGEETGNIESMMERVADYYDDEVDVATTQLTAAMEPLTIVVLAVIVGGIVAAVYSPILGMYDAVDAQ